MVESFASSVNDPLWSVIVRPMSNQKVSEVELKWLQDFVKVEVGNLLEIWPVAGWENAQEYADSWRSPPARRSQRILVARRLSTTQSEFLMQTLNAGINGKGFFAARLWGGSVHPSIVAMPLVGHAVVLLPSFDDGLVGESCKHAENWWEDQEDDILDALTKEDPLDEEHPNRRYTFIERGFTLSTSIAGSSNDSQMETFDEFECIRLAGLSHEPPLLIVAVNQSKHQAETLTMRLRQSGFDAHSVSCDADASQAVTDAALVAAIRECCFTVLREENTASAAAKAIIEKASELENQSTDESENIDDLMGHLAEQVGQAAQAADLESEVGQLMSLLSGTNNEELPPQPELCSTPELRRLTEKLGGVQIVDLLEKVALLTQNSASEDDWSQVEVELSSAQDRRGLRVKDSVQMIRHFGYRETQMVVEHVDIDSRSAILVHFLMRCISELENEEHNCDQQPEDEQQGSASETPEASQHMAAEHSNLVSASTMHTMNAIADHQLDPPVAEEVQDTRIVDFNESVQRAIEGIRTETNDSKAFKQCLAMMLRVTSNIQSNPSNKIFRTLKFSKTKLFRKVLVYSSAIEVLKYAGFIQNDATGLVPPGDEDTRLLHMNDVDMESLGCVISILERSIRSLELSAFSSLPLSPISHETSEIAAESHSPSGIYSP